MANIPPLPSNPASNTALLTPVAPSADNVLVGATILSLPDKLMDIARPVHINGIPLTLPENGVITLQTAGGNFTLQLLMASGANPQALADVLLPLVQNQKSLSLTLQPGNPPTQALLTLPAPATAPTHSLTNITSPPLNASAQSAASFIGQELTAAILPKGVAEAFTTSAATHETLSFLSLSGQAAEALAKSPASSSLTSLTNLLSSSLKLSPLTEFLKATTSNAISESLKNFIHDTQSSFIDTVTSPKTTAVPSESLSSPGTLLKSGAEWQVRIDTIVQPDKPLPTPLTTSQVTATVIGKGPEGQLLLATGDSTLYIRQNGNVPVGSKLVLTLLGPKAEPGFSFQPVSENLAPALQHLMSTLAALEPQLAAQVMKSHIPQPNATLPGALLFLFNAFNQNGVQGWLGDDATNRLGKMNKLELVAKLTDEMQQASGLARDPVIGQWRAWPLPLYDGNQFQMLHLYVRRDRDRKEAGAGYPVSPQTRFLITMNMSRLGPMQMDGLSQKKKLDLIIRTENPLPSNLPNSLRTTYIKTLEALDLTGSLNFQTGKQNWVAVRKVTESEGFVT